MIRIARLMPHVRSSCHLPLLLLLQLLVTSGSNAVPRSSPPADSPYYDDPLLESILNLAQVPPLNSKSSNSHSTQSSLHQDRQRDQQQPLIEDDFVFTTGSCRERMPLTRSTRAWRNRIRAFILIDQDLEESLTRLNLEGEVHNESYAFFPDDRHDLLGGTAHGTKQGDTRAAVAPFAAHRHFGETYKWMLYGDDDTLFFMEPVKRMLASFDPSLPLALSDNLWYLSYQPNAHAPRCLPCHMANATLPSVEELVKTPHVREHIRKYLLLRTANDNVTDAEIDAVLEDARGVPGRLFVPTAACPICTPDLACNRKSNPEGPCNPSVAHGGAGMIFSVGLMRSIAYREAMACIRSFRSATGGDAIVSSCFWRHGIAFTDPGPLVRHLYDPHYHVFGGKAGQGYLMDPIGMITHGRCNSKCRWMLRNSLSLHLKGRHYRSWRVGSVLMWGVAHASVAAHAFLDMTARDGGVSWRQLPYGYDIDDAVGFAPYMALAAPPTVLATGMAADKDSST
ncbi:hypothetical protein VaNZ11_012358 [Volvox africanus]|uniref:Uncharacterized protein n=1 Tax=Volvox africanus TaxID=51714 RepID=A0ABQ5SDS8_9CHLO|nr:hypothetical protein VaNZ11_012358 [Volvox africanus]